MNTLRFLLFFLIGIRICTGIFPNSAPAFLPDPSNRIFPAHVHVVRDGSFDRSQRKNLISEVLRVRIPEPIPGILG
jgi:hypothetical protein